MNLLYAACSCQLTGGYSEHPNSSAVAILWVRMGREHPVAPYSDVIPNYGSLDPEQRASRERGVDQLFTAEELSLMKEYVETTLEWAVWEDPVRLPTVYSLDRTPVLTEPTFEILRLDEEEGYPLPFPVWGICAPGRVKADLHLAAMPTDGKSLLKCPICGSTVSRYTKGFVLWDGERELGPVCEPCLERGPVSGSHYLLEASHERTKEAHHLEAASNSLREITDWANLSTRPMR